MKASRYILPSLVILMSVTHSETHAVTIDYRHEMTDSGSKNQKDRVLISHRFTSGFGISSEVKWKQSDKSQGTNQPWHEPVSHGSEFIPSYLVKFNDYLSLESGLSLESTSDFNSYRPYLRSYSNITDQLNISLRYRPYYKRISSNIGTEKNTQETGYAIGTFITFAVTEDIKIIYENEFNKANSAGAVLYNNKNHNMNHDISMYYKFEKYWVPYIAVANIEGNNRTNDRRQTRYRIGIQYVF